MDCMHVNVTYAITNKNVIYANAAHVKHNTLTITVFVAVAIFVRVNRCIQLGVLIAGPARVRSNPARFGLGLDM